MISLHHHSTFSTLDAIGLPDQIVARCKELGREVISLTDHDTVFSHPFLQKACAGNGIHPIFGCEMRLVKEIQNNSRGKYHITILARTQEGYANLMKLVSRSYSPDFFYYKPTIDIATLEELSEGLTVLSGCPSSMLNAYILNGELAKAIALVKKFVDIFGDHFYLEIMPHDMEETAVIAPAVRAMHQKYGIPVVLTNDDHYMKKGQSKLQRILHCIRNRCTIDEYEGMLPSLYLMDDDEAWAHANLHLGKFFTQRELWQTFTNQEKIASDCSAKVMQGEFVDYGSEDPFNELRSRVYDGLEKIGKADDTEYGDRVDRELDLISRKGFANYFLVVSDIVNWAKRAGIFTGPSRGSSACSLVALCVGITETNPMKHGLIMERFLSEDRNDLPDIDIDFEDRKRDQVIQYMHERFSRGNVAHLSTLVRFMGRNTLRELGKVFDIPATEIEQVQNVLIQRGSADARSSATIEDTFNEFSVARRVAEEYPDILYARDLEWQIRHVGVHAAGLVVSNSPLTNFTAVMTKEVVGVGKGANVAMLTGESVYVVGLPKIDILGLKTLSMLSDMAEEAGIESRELYDMEYGDSEALDRFNGNTLGIFQFGSPSTSSIAKQFGVSTFGDVTLATALSRPGPLHSQQAQLMITAKRDGSKKTWELDLLNDITKDTYGYVAFQEQVIRIMREVGGMDWKDVSAVRNAMSRSLGDEFFDKYRGMFVEGSAKMFGLTSEAANDIFDHTSTFGSWAFNLAHAVGYSIISYWTAWFKAHYPRTFYQVMCNYNIGDREKMKAFLREYVEREYGRILPPKMNKSGVGWAVEGDDLRAGLSTVLPEGASGIIASLYPVKDEGDLIARIPDRRRVNSRVLRLMEENRIFEEGDDFDPFGLYAFAERMGYVSDRTHRIGDLGYDFGMREVVIAGVFDKQINEKSIQELKDTVKLSDWRQRFDEKYGDKWCIIPLRDETGQVINVHVKNRLYNIPDIKDMLWAQKLGEDIIVVKGLIPPGMSHLVAKQIWEWSDRKHEGARCYKCPLIKAGYCPPGGNPSADILFLGMCPGVDEVANSRSFSGRSGQHLDGILRGLGISNRDKILWITNAALCRPTDDSGSNRDPSDVELACCYDRLMAEIERVSPKVVVTMGATAYRALTGEVIKMREMAGTRIEMNGYAVIPSYHPAAALYPGRDQQAINNSIRESITLALGTAKVSVQAVAVGNGD